MYKSPPLLKQHLFRHTDPMKHDLSVTRVGPLPPFWFRPMSQLTRFVSCTQSVHAKLVSTAQHISQPCFLETNKLFQSTNKLHCGLSASPGLTREAYTNWDAVCSDPCKITWITTKAVLMRFIGYLRVARTTILIQFTTFAYVLAETPRGEPRAKPPQRTSSIKQRCTNTYRASPHYL